MRSLASRLLAAVQDALASACNASRAVEDRVDAIREAMLHSLGHAGGLFMTPLERDVLCAPDAETLWYLRAELLTVLAARDGERTARQQLAGITALFEGLLPWAAAVPRLAVSA